MKLEIISELRNSKNYIDQTRFRHFQLDSKIFTNCVMIKIVFLDNYGPHQLKYSKAKVCDPL